MGLEDTNGIRHLALQLTCFDCFHGPSPQQVKVPARRGKTARRSWFQNGRQRTQ
jgi:hypothetical protein